MRPTPPKTFRQPLRPRVSLGEYDKRLDHAVNEPFASAAPPDVLYHYTSWRGFEAIVQDRAFRATSHRHTNDENEIQVVDEIACQIAERLRYRGSAAAAQLMTKFVKRFPHLALSQVTTIFLSCFSSAHDEQIHWAKYAQGGAGLCMGVKVLSSESHPAEPRLGRVLRQVDYDQVSWEQRIERGFTNVVAAYERFLGSGAPMAAREDARSQALLALARVTGMAALGAKEAKWREEKEWRQVAMWFRGDETEPQSCVRADGTVAQFLLLPMRVAGRLLVLDEIIIGPKESQPDAETRVRGILERAGYPSDDAPIPRISRSRFTTD